MTRSVFVVAVLLGAWALSDSAPSATASCSAAPQARAAGTAVYRFSGIRFEERQFGAPVYIDALGQTCAPRGLGAWKISLTTTNEIKPSNTGTNIVTIVVKRAGQRAFDSTGNVSLTTLPGPRVRLSVKTIQVQTATAAVTAKPGSCKCPELQKGQRLARKPSKAIVDFIRGREKFRAKPYDDLGPGKGACTVGYGHVLHDSPCTGSEKSETKAQAEAQLDADIADKAADLARLVRVDLDQNQYDAMLDFAFNAGIAGRRTLLNALNSCNDGALFGQMRAVVTSKGQVLQELVARREYEIALYQK